VDDLTGDAGADRTSLRRECCELKVRYVNCRVPRACPTVERCRTLGNCPDWECARFSGRQVQSLVTSGPNWLAHRPQK